MSVAMFFSFERNTSAKILPFPQPEELVPAKNKKEPEMFLKILPEPLPLERVGPKLSSNGKTWHMLGFYSADKLRVTWWPKSTEREYFRVETDKEELWIFRPTGEKGMKALFLEGVFEKG